MGPKTFKIIIDRLFPIRKEFWGLYGRNFDYPDYGGLPKAVDAIQFILNIKFLRKRDFARAYKQKLKSLGEPGKY